MKKILFSFVFFAFSSGVAEEPVCKKCEVIREHNKQNPGDYEYYDDYLKAQGKEKKEPSAPTK